MIKAVLIDDEYIVLEGLKKLVNWNKYHIQIVATALDGISGLEIILKEKPSVVFIDIRMPGMNGLMVIEQAKLINPNIIFVILSGFSEFEYAKKAISLGVLDYIEKPVTIENIENVLKKINIYFEKNKQQMQKRNKLEKCLYDLLGGINSSEISKQNYDFDDINSVIKTEQNITLCIGQLCSWEHNYNEYFDIIKMTIRIANNHYDNDYIFINRNTRFLILYFGDINILKTLLIDCQMGCAKVDIVFCAALSSCFSGEGEVNALFLAWKQSSIVLQEILFSGNPRVELYNLVPTTKTSKIIDTELENNLLFYIQNNKYDEIKILIKEIFKKCNNMNLNKDEYYYIALEIIFIMFRVIKDTGKIFSNNDGSRFIPHVEINKCKDIIILQQWLLDKVEEILLWIYKISSLTYHKSILAVKDYIDNNYDLDISIIQLAEMAKLNIAYFSVIFKEEVGLSYIKYLTKIRMEKAKVFLNEGYKVNEVSLKTGYPNSRYFCELFKKYYGITPKQFKGSKRI